LEQNKIFKSGFVNIIGRPNVGKSTLMNALLGDRLSIITNKPQTTRHRIIGIHNDEECQIIFSDTPGIIKAPTYKMQEAMNRYSNSTFEDADVMMFVTEKIEKYADDDPIISRLRNVEAPLFLVYNKIDSMKEEEVLKAIGEWSKRLNFREIIPISALKKQNTAHLLALIKSYLKEGPKFYPDDQLTDRSERFFASEIIREKILTFYDDEVPYSCEVQIDEFKEGVTKDGKPIIRIFSTIYVMRKTQKPILIGTNGSALKKVGTEARKTMEQFFAQAVFLDINVKVRENWRDDDKMLDYFGYNR
jgi:GTPase